jgi:hypothetical protein
LVLAMSTSVPSLSTLDFSSTGPATAMSSSLDRRATTSTGAQSNAASRPLNSTSARGDGPWVGRSNTATNTDTCSGE